MAKKLIGIVLACLLLSGCGAQTAADLPKVLVEADGQTIMTKQDLQYAVMDQNLLEKMFGQKKRDIRQVFERYAEYRVAAFLAGQYGVEASKADAETKYENYMEELTDDNTIAYIKELKEKMGLSDQDFKAYKIDEEVMYESTQNLLEDIASQYQNVYNAEGIEDQIQQNLMEITKNAGITLHYPGVSRLDFSELLSENSEGETEGSVESNWLSSGRSAVSCSIWTAPLTSETR